MTLHKSAILEALPKEGFDLLEAVKGLDPYFHFNDRMVQDMIDDLDIKVLEAAKLYLNSYSGSNSFVLSVKGKLPYKDISLRQARAVLNCLQKDSSPLDRTSCSIGLPDPSPATSTTLLPPPYVAPAPVPTYVAPAPAYVPPPFKTTCRSCGFISHSSEEHAKHRREHYDPLFEKVPQSGLDLNAIPEGRYAVPNLASGEDDYIFLQVRKVPKDTFRSKKYRYGWVSYGKERVASGTLEVRQWHGDAKELVGEQRPQETYRGIFLNELGLAIKDPVASSRLFGMLINCCGKCGRTLTDPVSRKIGIGPECVKHFAASPTRSVHSTSIEAPETKESLTEKLKVLGRPSSTASIWTT